MGGQRSHSYNDNDNDTSSRYWERRSLPTEKKRVCYLWQTTGMCRFGSSCRYQHDKEHAYAKPDYAHRLWSSSQASTSRAERAKPFGADDVWDFSVMSYNVLADELAVTHAKELYKAVPDSCLHWPIRMKKLLDEILHWRPDVICLQEIDHPEDFTNALGPGGYNWQYAARTGGRIDGCLTLWRKDRFEAIARDCISMEKYGLRDNVGVIVVLRPHATCLPVTTSGNVQTATYSSLGPAFAVANTHLLFNPKRGDIKLGQAGTILRRIALICKDLSIEPLAIFTGDFNSTPQSAICSFIREGMLDCFLEDRRNLSGQLESAERGWPLRSRESRQAAALDIGRKRGRSLDDLSRSDCTQLGLAADATLPAQRNVPFPPAYGMAAIGIVMNQQPAPGGTRNIPHSGSFPLMPQMGAHLQDGRYSGPVSTPGQGPLYPYTDQYGQVAWSHIPPSDAFIKRQPFYHEPMRVEEANPPPPPPPPPGVFRTLSFAQRQMNAGTWTQEQLMLATGYSPHDGQQFTPNQNLVRGSQFPVPSANDSWSAEHPLRMQSTYEAVLGSEPAYTSCHGKFIGTVDYVWFTPKAGNVRLTPTSVLLPPPLESLHCGLPSPEWPSDHISLLARFTLTTQAGSYARD